MTEQASGGTLIARSLGTLGVSHLFTLTGGHIFPILDGCRRACIGIIDVRHEQTAGYAAEGWARLTRSLGVAAVTAGPGVTNVLSAMAQARFNNAPILVLAGRAPAFRWGQGSLQEIDHIPFVDPVAPAETVYATSRLPEAVIDAAVSALSAPRGPRFVDVPLDTLFNRAHEALPTPPEPRMASPDPSEVEKAAAALSSAERPVIVAGSNVWLDGAEEALRRLAEDHRIPVFMNGQGRGCLSSDHALAFARARSRALREADTVIVAGTPLDFRLGFGQGFASGCRVVHIDSGGAASPVELHAGMACSTRPALEAIHDALERSPATTAWLAALRSEEDRRREEEAADLTSSQKPIHPLRIYGELIPLLERDAVVIGDGGDFVSFAGRVMPSYTAGSWLDPGPFGCLGAGPGYAIAARLVHPERQVLLLCGDGALGFSMGDLETLVRLGLPVVVVVGNNGIWALEKHPMRALYGCDVAADLLPGTRYDLVMQGLGGRGEHVTDPDEIAPALKRALASREPALVNIETDPDVAYPRSANLA
jgi:acetolactate synthase-1/2/3 large subunit